MTYRPLLIAFFALISACETDGTPAASNGTLAPCTSTQTAACVCEGGTGIARCGDDKKFGACNCDTLQQAGFHDKQVAAAILALNRGGISLGQAGVSRASKKDVVDFAKLEVSGHQTAVTIAESNFASKELDPIDSDVSRKVESDLQKTLSDLSSKSDAEFDKAFVDAEVAFHESGSTLIDTTLRLGAQYIGAAGIDPALSAFQSHLTQVKAIRDNL